MNQDFDPEADFGSYQTFAWIEKTQEQLNEMQASGLIDQRIMRAVKSQLKAKGMNPWQAIEKWWTAIPDMSFPIMIHEGAFTFNADGVDKVVPYKVLIPAS